MSGTDGRRARRRLRLVKAGRRESERGTRAGGAHPAPVAPPLDEAIAARALGALAVTLALLLAVRAELTFSHGMWMWSLNLQRFLAPAVLWPLWALAALALVPALARRALPVIERAGDAALDRPRRTTALWALAAALLVLALPDRVQFVGDFLLRQSTLQTLGALPTLWYPQAMPLDLIVHDTLPRLLLGVTGISAYAAGRLIGMLEAAALGALAVALARELGLRGAAGFAATAIVLFGGDLTLFTGYNKCFSEMTLVPALAGLAMLRLARAPAADARAGSLLPLGLVLTAGALLHRSTLALYPAALLAAWMWLRARPGAAGRPANLLAFALPIAAQLLVLPRMLSVMNTVDARHFAPADVAAHGWLAATLGPVRLLDLFNLVMLLSPVFPSALVMLMIERGAWRARAGFAPLALLAGTLLAMAVLVHPQQGVFRDWDVFATLGMALSLIAALVIGESLRAAPSRAWLAVPVALIAAVFTIQWLANQSDLERGLARVQAFMSEPPARGEPYSTTTWEYLGMRNLRAGRAEDAALAYREAARRLPSPNLLRQLGAAEEGAGHWDRARDVYRLMLSRNPADSLAAGRLRRAAAQLGATSADSGGVAPPAPAGASRPR